MMLTCEAKYKVLMSDPSLGKERSPYYTQCT